MIDHILMAEPIHNKGTNGYMLHVFRDREQANAYANLGHRIIEPQKCYGRKYPGQDFTRSYEGFELDCWISSKKTNPTTTQKGQLKMTAQPTTPTTQPTTAKSEALELLKQAIEKIDILNNKIARLERIVEALTTQQQQAAQPTAQAQPQAAATKKPQPHYEPFANGGPTRTFTMDAIKAEFTSDGQLCYKALGQPFSQFGVRVWPEVLPLIAPDLDQSSLKPGSKLPVTPRAVVVALSEEGKPRKVIGLAQAA